MSYRPAERCLTNAEQSAKVIDAPPMKSLIALSFLIILGWTAVVTFAGPDLAKAITEGRRREFSSFARFSDPEVRERIPDPNAVATFTDSILDWQTISDEPHRQTLALYQQLLTLRREWITPRLPGMGNGAPQTTVHSDSAFSASWRLGDGSRLLLSANLGEAPIELPNATVATVDGAQLIFATANLDHDALGQGLSHFAPWSLAWHLQMKASS